MIFRTSCELASVGCALLVVVFVVGIRLVPYLPPPAGPFRVGTVLWDIDRSGTDSIPSVRAEVARYRYSSGIRRSRRPATDVRLIVQAPAYFRPSAGFVPAQR